MYQFIPMTTVKNEILDLFNFITLISELIKCDMIN